MEEELSRTEGNWLPGRQRASAEAIAGFRRRFDESLDASDLAACPYHRANWLVVAVVACAFVADADAEWSQDELDRRAQRAALSAQDHRVLGSLFSEPINWAPGETELTNGQHRSCALRHSGAAQCPVIGR